MEIIPFAGTDGAFYLLQKVGLLYEALFEMKTLKTVNLGGVCGASAPQTPPILSPGIKDFVGG